MHFTQTPQSSLKIRKLRVCPAASKWQTKYF